MCRLFGMSSAPRRVRATFWLLRAPDSLTVQSRRDPDGTGLGHFDGGGRPVLHRAPVAAYEDRAFAEEARNVESSTFVAHVRYATTGGPRPGNTHPFEQEGRLFAHNGVVEGLDRLEDRLGEDLDLVEGGTDSERVFALITQEIRRRDGDVTEGVIGAVRWIAANLPLYAVNLVLTTENGLWALRYPDTHGLYVLERHTGGHRGDQRLDHAGTGGRMRVRSDDLAGAPAVVVASERLDDNPGWRPIRPGELLHVGPGPAVASRLVLPDPPAHPLTPAGLRPGAAGAQGAA